jgi:hypothetical protein
MMDVNSHYEMRRQQYQDMLREAEQYRLARELGLIEVGARRSIVARLRVWLSQIRSSKVNSSEIAAVQTERLLSQTKPPTEMVGGSFSK